MLTMLWTDYLIMLLLGLSAGSFSNVLIYRLPRMTSVSEQQKPYNLFIPRSHCIQCAQTIAWFDNIPVLSWLLLRGFTRCCQHSISPRYPMMELLGGLLFVCVFWYTRNNVLSGVLIAMSLILIGSLIVQFVEYRYLSRALLYVLLWYALLLPTIDMVAASVVPAHVYFSESNPLRMQIISAIVGLGTGVIMTLHPPVNHKLAMPAFLGAIGAWLSWLAVPIFACLILFISTRKYERAPKNMRSIYRPYPMPHKLCVVPRRLSKASRAGVVEGEDWWRAWEFSWLLGETLSCRCGVLQLRVPADSLSLIESKSLKLYLFSLRNQVFMDTDSVQKEIEDTLSIRLGVRLEGQILTLSDPLLLRTDCAGVCLDNPDINVIPHRKQRARNLLRTHGSGEGSEILYTNSFRSLCPISGQPDWATICIRYTGAPIQHEGLLQYLLSYGSVNHFHEHCVEQIFSDIWYFCTPKTLMVEGFFLRRGGIDICPRRFSRGDYLELRATPKPLIRQ